LLVVVRLQLLAPPCYHFCNYCNYKRCHCCCA
jgi:hypothetical protein